ncbi:MAG: beta-glucosidase [Lachnospiraceae bacterium]|nr:beta-glucosidase [Lachnospiraceae bacterium]
MQYFADTTNEISKRELDNMALSRQLAGECVVLLKNDGALPIQEPGKVALFGTGARYTVKGGTGSGDVNSRSVVNIDEGLKEAGFTLVSGDWFDCLEAAIAENDAAHTKLCEAYAKEHGCPIFVANFDNKKAEPIPPIITEAQLKASEADTAIYVISRNSGEGGDRKAEAGDYYLYDSEIQNIRTLSEQYKNTILVLNIGGVMDLSAVCGMKGLNAIVLMSQLGNIGGNVLADVLLGKVNPSGKTTDTWAKKYQDYPNSATFSFNNGNVHDEYYEEGIYVGYRYFDSFDVEPLYEFGFGLSYTTFEMETVSVCQKHNEIVLSVRVKNTGSVAGKEVVQIYVSQPQGDGAIPFQKLVGYQKTKCLQPAEEQILTVEIPIHRLSAYSEAKSAWILTAGKYVFRVGNSSKNTQVAAVAAVDVDMVTEQCKALFAMDESMNVKRAKIAPYEGEVDFTIDLNEIVAIQHQYQGVRKELKPSVSNPIRMEDVISGRYSMEDLVAQLTVEEMADLCVGTARTGGEVIGSASTKVPGAAGDTSAKLEETRGIRGLALADGPAGLRLVPHFIVDASGKLVRQEESLGGLNTGATIEGPSAEEKEYFQYCTAIPIGWALAMSWNTEIVKQVGRMIGGEMEHFHVDIWLAPAMNIHRNPLCGRNFEYYSEDPYIAGTIAAAMTCGVQSVPGKGTCIKHFAVNNQEENRYFSNAHVNEQTLREIYLNGFEYAVRESKPMSVMSSYNLLNGEHTANSYDLQQSMLRDEWGFDGFVMTDWFTSQYVKELCGKYDPVYPISASTGCIKAANDLQMPGCQKNVDDIVEAVHTQKELDGYQITKGDLQYCAVNILRIVATCMKADR